MIKPESVNAVKSFIHKMSGKDRAYAIDGYGYEKAFRHVFLRIMFPIITEKHQSKGEKLCRIRRLTIIDSCKAYNPFDLS